MCGRFSLTATNDELMQRFGVVVTQNMTPRWNIAPSQTSLVLRSDGLTMSDQTAQFGVHSTSLNKRIINARSETISEKPFFREAFRARRCLVPASGWYEWDKTKQPYHVQLIDGRVMGLAGIMFETSRSGDGAFVLLTTASDGVLSSVHHRCPLVLATASWQSWLNGDEMLARSHLVTPDPRFFNLYPVSRAVGSVKADRADLVAPLSPADQEAEALKAGVTHPGSTADQHDLFS